MAVEDHPGYPKWSEAWEKVRAANEAYTQALQNGEPDVGVAVLESELKSARAWYTSVSASLSA